MGICLGKREVTKEELVQELKRIRFTAEQRQIRLSKDYEASVNNLIATIQAPLQLTRSKLMEREMIKTSVGLSNQRQISKIISWEATKILQYSSLLDDANGINRIEGNLNVLACCSKYLHDQELAQFQFCVRTKYPQLRLPKPDLLTYELLKLYCNKPTDRVTEKMECDFVMEMCHTHGIALQKVNQVGHNYRY